MLSTDKHCELLTNLARDKSAAIYDSFKLFVQLFSGIVGGSVVVRLQYGQTVPAGYVALSNALSALVVITCAVMILDAFRSWYGYSQKLSAVSGVSERGDILIARPSLYVSARTVAVMLGVMALALVGLIRFNPLQISN
jgi:hypothetical protein